MSRFRSIDYKRNRAATTYGRGLDVRLFGQEIEFRFADRLLAYSMLVRGAGAALNSGRQRPIAIVWREFTAREESQPLADRGK
ncbi:MAG: hypothetical protein ACK6DZ_11890 [Acidobacteriota bacterium]